MFHDMNTGSDNLFFACRINVHFPPVSNDVRCRFWCWKSNFRSSAVKSELRRVRYVTKTRAVEVTFIMLTNANVNRNDRRARTEEYSRKVRTVVSAVGEIRAPRGPLVSLRFAENVTRRILSARRNCATTGGEEKRAPLSAIRRT